MTHTFEQQQKPSTQYLLKSAPTPQHGRKLDPDAAKLVGRRSFEPRPGH